MTSIFQAGQPFNVVRTSSTTYQANDKDLVISSGDEVALPSPNQGTTILVRPAPSIDSVNITTSNGTIGNTGDTFGIYRATEPIYLVGDGTDWYARSGGGEISAIPDSALTQDLVAWYRFEDGDARDYASNAEFPNVTWGDSTAYNGTVNDGTVQSSGGVTDFEQGANSGSYDTNNSGHITIDQSAFDKSGPVTVLMWVKTNSLQPSQRAFSTDISNNDSPRGALIQEKGDGGSYAIFTPETGVVPIGSINVGTFQQVGFVIDGESIFGVIDGNKNLEQSPGSFTDSGNRIAIGDEPARGIQYDGVIDELRIYNTDLTGTQISDIYNATEP